MQQFLSNGGLSKMLWIILCFITALGALVMAGFEIIRGEPINQYVAYVLVGILSHAFTIGGSVNTSSQLEKKDEFMNAFTTPTGHQGT